MSGAPSVQPVPPHSQPSVEEVLALLTREEKASLLAGVNDWYLRGIPRLDIPSIRVTDCGHGVTLCGEETSPATCFPTGIGMAATWNEELLEEAGSVLGRETRALGCSLLLGPKINLHRHPLNGRSFETFSEDPWLAGKLGAAVIRGIQSTGVGACVKAMAANNQQKDQEKVSAEVDERTLREIYLRAFEVAIELGRPRAIMTAYNRLNGEYCSESSWLIDDIVKREWAFPGMVVSDWRAVHSATAYGSGLDLEMPGPGKLFHRQGILHALEEGLLTEEELDDKARRVLRTIMLSAPDASGLPTGALDTAEHRATALAVAEESIVLLKNEGRLLPLDRHSLRKLLVVGPNAAEARLGGGGSASVTPFYTVNPLDGIRELCGSEVEVQFLEGCSLVGSMEPIRDCFSHAGTDGTPLPGLRVDFYNAQHPAEQADASWSVPQVDFSWGWASPGPGVQREFFVARFSGWLTPPKSGRYRLGIYAQEGCLTLEIDGESILSAWDSVDGNFEEKYQTRYHSFEYDFQEGVPVRLDLVYGKRAARAGLRFEWEIPGAANPIDKAVEAACEADAVIVCAGLSNLFEGGAHDRQNIDLPPIQEDLIRRLSAANPKTIVTVFNGGPLAFPWIAHVPCLLEAWYPGQEGGRALARILFGLTNPSGHLPDTVAHRLEDHAAMTNYPGDGETVKYDEGIFIGYRHFDSAGIEPQFPFGFGLSYTSFTISAPSIDRPVIRKGDRILVTATVKNTGPRPGKEVVQLYVRQIDPAMPRPVKELRAFMKVSLLPGEEKTVPFLVGERELQTFDPEISRWHVAPGKYELLVGAHSRSVQGATLSVVH